MTNGLFAAGLENRVHAVEGELALLFTDLLGDDVGELLEFVGLQADVEAYVQVRAKLHGRGKRREGASSRSRQVRMSLAKMSPNRCSLR